LCALHLSRSVKHSRERPRWLLRRLITLIFADRDKPAVMVVIRRELPRTKLVGLAERPVT
jgi:hypothetical protein